MARIHPTAVVDARAEVADDVVVGPLAVVEAGAVIASGCVIHTHAVVRGASLLGPRNTVHPFAVIGGEAQAKRAVVNPSSVEIGEGNVFREHTTVHGGTHGGVTRIGAFNLFMVGCHVAHDVIVGSHCVVANAVQLAGHVVVEDHVTFGGLSGVAQYARIGESAFVAAASACERDVPPFVVVQGDRARVRAINVVGLRRRGIPGASIAALERAARRLWGVGPRTRAEVLKELEADTDVYVRRLVTALRAEGPKRKPSP